MLRSKSLLFALFSCLLVSSCVSVKPIYNADEQAKAERAVSELHRMYNEQDFDGIFNLFHPEARQSITRDAIVASLKESFARTGKIRNSELSQAKVFPGSPIQVRMIYNIESEKGEPFQEWFIWATDDHNASLLQAQTFPGHDKGETK